MTGVLGGERFVGPDEAPFVWHAVACRARLLDEAIVADYSGYVVLLQRQLIRSKINRLAILAIDLIFVVLSSLWNHCWLVFT